LSTPVNIGLQSLDIDNFRNIKHACLSFSPSVNLITGLNAAGKTSLLEAIYCLGRVRSFRALNANHLVHEGESFYRLVGKIGLTGGRTVPIGIERYQGNYRIHLEGQPVQRLSDLAGRFPVQIMTSDTANILSGGPGYRRQSLDWALFHVEQGYRLLWQRYSRVLRQRNAALRVHAPPVQIMTWDRELANAADGLDRLRREYITDLQPYIQNELDSLLPGMSMSLRYASGWPGAATLEAALKSNLDKDLARGYTHYGPHRADMLLMVDGKPVQTNLSRGQQKAMIVAFLIGQVKFQYALNAPRGALLLDDLGSELDEAYQSRILCCLKEIGIQVFVTAINSQTAKLTEWPRMKRFHVEHGVVREVL
jgi:DNA replication and repair protein RecF